MAKDLKSAMLRSLESERSTLDARFFKAEALLGTTEKTPEPVAPKITQVVRDSFTLPESDHQLLTQLKTRGLSLGIGVNKSELVRAGLRVLAALSDEDFRAALAAIERIKTGRPK